MQPSQLRSDYSLLPLPHPAEYFPPRNGRYTVTPSLHRLGTDFGNGPSDTRLFQFDEDFSRFRKNKLLCRAENFSKYVCEAGLTHRVREAVIRLLLERLTAEYPDLFLWNEGADKRGSLHCRLTGETIRLDLRGTLIDAAPGPDPSDNPAPPYSDSFDALCCQVPEDLAVICRDESGDDRLAQLHLCAPSHWAPEEKIGKCWSETHAPVPGMEKSRSAAHSIVGVMIERRPAVRFTWGIEFNDRLNQHPAPPPGVDAEVWRQRHFINDAPEPFYLRVERQVIWGMPDVNAALFTIRIYLTPASVIRADNTRRQALYAALLSMSEDSLRYKGLLECSGEILSYLSE